MSQKWFAFLAFVWVVCMLMGSTFEKHTSNPGTADSGSFTSLTDSALTQAEDYWEGKTVVITETTDRKAPAREPRTVTSFSAATNTLYFEKMSAPVDAGDNYAVGDWFGLTGQSKLQYLTSIKHIMYEEGETGLLTWVTPNPEYFKALWQVIAWDFTFMRGEGYEIVRWIVLMPFTMAVVIGLVMTFVNFAQGFIRR